MKKNILQIFFTLCAVMTTAVCVSVNVKAVSTYGDTDAMVIYTDDSDIVYKEAVDVLSALNIIGGYPDGSFRPDARLSRGAAAKMIACLCNSNDLVLAANSSIQNYCDYESVFADVDPFGTFTKYINYCADRGFVDGTFTDEDGNRFFQPGEPVSVHAFLKMLLCALGYDPAQNSYIGTGWQTYVYRDAIRTRLVNGLHETFAPGDLITRQQAVLFMLNTLCTDLVSSVANSPRITDSAELRYANIDTRTDENGNALIQFAEQYFKRLRRIENPETQTVRWAFLQAIDGIWQEKRNEDGSYSDAYTYDLSPDSWILTFHPNGGTVQTIDGIRLVYSGETYGTVAPLPVAVRDGYTFLGWSTRPDSGELIDDNTPVNLEQDQILYAHWSSDIYDHTVTFNASGGVPDYSTRIVASGEPYGILPGAVREGYRFDGWYTEQTGGLQIHEDSISELTESQTLYAHWTPAWVVTFNSTGGNALKFNPRNTQGQPEAIMVTKTVFEGEPYGTLPDPGRNEQDPALAFLGWYDGNTRITPDTVVHLSGNQTLNARWSAAPVTLLFNANGGIVTLHRNGSVIHTGTGLYQEASGTNARIILNEYVPEREGYRFTGWFIFQGEGTLKKPYEKQKPPGIYTVSNRPLQIFYADWEAETENITDQDVFSQLTYQYVNKFIYPESGQMLYLYMFDYKPDLHEEGFYTPEEITQFSSLKNLARANVLYEATYNANSDGVCYGMVTTSAMFYVRDNGISIADFAPDARYPRDLKFGVLGDVGSQGDKNSKWGRMNIVTADGVYLSEFIAAMQISQAGIYFCKADWENSNDFTALCNAVESFERSEANRTSPVVICIYNASHAHALLGYRLEKKSDEEDWLYVYDCNYPKDRGRYIIMQKNVKGVYTGWSYTGAPAAESNKPERYASDLSGGRISFIPYEVYKQSWDNRGRPDTYMSGQNTAADSYILLHTSALHATVSNASGQTIARFRNSMMTEWDGKTEIYPVPASLTGGNATGSGVAVWLPADGVYTIHNEDEQNDYTMSIANLTDGLIIHHTTAVSAELSVQDGIRLSADIPEPGADCELCVMTTARMGNCEEIPQSGLPENESRLTVNFDGTRMFINGAQGNVTVNDVHYGNNVYLHVAE